MDVDITSQITIPEDGADLLDNVRAWLARFVCTVNASDLDLLTVWAVHTHLAVETYTTPRLQLDSPMPGSGKTTCLEHLFRLCVRPVQMANVSSPALLARLLEKEIRTLLIDEADRSLNPDKPGIADLLAMLNSGYKRGATRPVLVPVKGGGWEPQEMPTFAPVAIAGNNPSLPEDTRSRIIRVLLLPDLDGVADESDWELIEDDAGELAGRIAAWADLVRDEIRECRPPLPAGVTGRFREKWLPLRRVAEMAGRQWPGLVDEMALQDREEYDMDREDGLIRERPAVLLLRHLMEVWPGEQPFVPTTELVDRLVGRHPESWGNESPYGKALTQQRLGRMLVGSYKVHSCRRPDGDRERGYRRADLEHAWRRVDPTSRTGRTGQAGRTGRETHGSNGSNTTNGSDPSSLTASSGPSGSKPGPVSNRPTCSHPGCSTLLVPREAEWGVCYDHRDGGAA